MATESARLRAAKSFIAFFDTLDTSFLSPLLSDDAFTYIMAPASLAVPPFSKAGFLAHVTGLWKILSGFSMQVKESLESESGNSVVVWATARANFREEVKRDAGEGFQYEGEYVFIMTMDASGEKVVRVVEMLDSLKTERDLRPMIKTAWAKVAALEGDAGGRE